MTAELRSYLTRLTAQLDVVINSLKTGMLDPSDMSVQMLIYQSRELSRIYNEL